MLKGDGAEAADSLVVVGEETLGCLPASVQVDDWLLSTPAATVAAVLIDRQRIQGWKAKHHPSASAVRVRLVLVRRCGPVLFNLWPPPLLLLLLP